QCMKNVSNGFGHLLNSGTLDGLAARSAKCFRSAFFTAIIRAPCTTGTGNWKAPAFSGGFHT
ncbi:MAG TPA: hypothetical protein PKC72_17015, partial [Chitinophagaceae bacterium]|nr:hypothetical protein [Chitinophagaceae bacterium]